MPELLLARYRLTPSSIRVRDRRFFCQAWDPLFERFVAIKGIWGTNLTPELEGLAEEYRQLRQLSAPRIPRAFSLERAILPAGEEPWSAHPLRFFTQTWLEGSSLSELPPLHAVAARQLMIEVLYLTDQLHQRGLYRFDLTPDHLIHRDGSWHWIDLELMTTQTGTPLDGLGTPAYLAPEVLAGQPYTPAADLYSLGAVIWEAITKRPHFPSGSDLATLQAWRLAHPQPALPDTFGHDDPALTQLLAALLSPDASVRPTASQALTMLNASEPAPTHCSRLLPALRPPLVASELLLEEAEQWRRTAAETGGGLLICGPEAAGRSRLLEALADQWQVQGLPVLHLSPQAMPAAPHRFFEQLLLALAPELPPSPIMSDTQEDSDLRTRQEEYVVSVLQRLVETTRKYRDEAGHPLLLILDDSQELEDRSARIFRRLLPLLRRARLLLIFEQTLPWPSPDVQPRRDESPPLTQLWTRPITLPELLQMWESYSGNHPQSLEPARQLLEVTQGRAGACVRALSQQLAPQPSLTPELEHDAMALSVLERNLDRELACLLLEPEAAGGMDETPTMAESSLQTTLAQPPKGIPLESRLARLELSGLLISSLHPDGSRRWHWTSPLQRNALRQRLPVDQRQHLSLIAAELLESRALEDETLAEPLSQVLLLAGEASRARPWLQRAAELAQKDLLLERAESRLSQLLATWKTLPPSLWEQQLKQAELLYARGASERALSKADVLANDGRATLPLKARAGLVKGRALLLLERYEEARLTLESISETVLPLAEQLQRLHSLSWLALRTRRLQDCPPLLSQSEARLAQLNCTPERIRLFWPGLPARHRRLYLETLRYQAWFQLETQDTLESPDGLQLLKRLDAALTLPFSPETDVSSLNLMETQAELLACMGRPAAAHQIATRALELSRKRLMMQQEANVSVNLGRYAWDTGMQTQALEALERAIRLYRHLNAPGPELRALLSQADILLELGHYSEVKRILGNLSDRLRGQNGAQRLMMAWYSLTSLRLQMRLGLEARWDLVQPEEVDGLLLQARTILLEARQPALARMALVDRLEWAERSLQNGGDGAELPSLDALWREASALETLTLLNQDPHTWHRLHGLLARLHGRLEYRLRTQLQLTHQSGWQETMSPISLEPDKQLPSGARNVSRGLDLQLLSCVRAMDHGEDKLAAELARLVGEQFQGRGVIGLRKGEGFEILQGYGIEPEQTRRVSRQLMGQVSASRQAILCFDVQRNEDLSSLQTIRQSRASSVLCWPIVYQEECLGVLYVDRQRPFELTEVQARKLMEHVARLCVELLNSLRRRQKQVEEPAPYFEGLIGDSAPMRRLRRDLADVLRAQSDIVFFDGETGTGKTLVAGILHHKSARGQHKMIEADALGAAAGTFESQFFGHRRGAFTGAVADHIGYLEAANNSTLFIDEIGELPLETQKKFLRMLGDKKKFTRLGDTQERHSNFHLITATNRDLAREVKEGRFREDLYYRIRANRIHLPSLRQRGPDDIALLSLDQVAKIIEKKPSQKYLDLERYFEVDAMDFLLYRHPWTGNVRELINLFCAASLQNRLKDQKRISRSMVEALLLEQGAAPEPPLPPAGMNLDELKEWYKRLRQRYVQREIERDQGNVSATARRLGSLKLRSQLIKIRDGKDQEGEE